ncbi:MAG TPA: phosphoribosylanthranilate isomerase [Caulifigura sp.]|jgi:phosphoribosylanthranilate isomerase|nr:phosphoribosylanthranilate isomerase [Caulifigura sp.]
MFVKICGIRDVDTACSVADCRPDAIGLNFYRQSARWLDVRMAERICRSLPAEVEPIGVFVNHPLEEILEITRNCRVATVQLHGDEPVELASRLVDAGLEVIRALRIDDANVGRLAEFVAEYRSVPLRALLVDARMAGAYGGTGRTAPWEPLTTAWQCDWPPLLLAGGLTPDNVAAAIAASGCWGVDTAGGVESGPAIKDPARVRAFISAARDGHST